MKIELGKQYRTRDGREVRIYAVDGGEDNNGVHGAIKYGWGWGATQWYPHGGYLSGLVDPRDLIEVKPRIQRKVWLDVYPAGYKLYGDRETADRLCVRDERLACVEIDIDVEEGHGL